LAADPETPNKLIAWEMGDISLHTVRALLRTASMRTGSKSRHELAAWYRDWAAQERIAA
jgi:DNA-binding CsgD family transcriptional regulator